MAIAISEITSSQPAAVAQRSERPIAQSKPAIARQPDADTVELSSAARTAPLSPTAVTTKIPTPIQVQLLAGQGQTVAQIAAKLNLSIRTVTAYLATPQG